jgi:hypothetical protein
MQEAVTDEQATRTCGEDFPRTEMKCRELGAAFGRTKRTHHESHVIRAIRGFSLCPSVALSSLFESETFAALRICVIPFFL